MNYSFFLRGRRRAAVRDVVDGDTVFLRGRLGTTARDAVVGDAAFLRGRLGTAARDFVDGNTVLGSVDTALGASTCDTIVRDRAGVGVGETVGDSGTPPTVNACT